MDEYLKRLADKETTILRRKVDSAIHRIIKRPILTRDTVAKHVLHQLHEQILSGEPLSKEDLAVFKAISDYEWAPTEDQKTTPLEFNFQITTRQEYQDDRAPEEAPAEEDTGKKAKPRKRGPGKPKKKG